MKIFALASITAVPALVSNTAAVGTPNTASDNIVSVATGGAGIYTLTLAAPGIDAAESAVHVTERGTLAASGMSSFAVSHTSDTVKVITCLREAAAGAASTLVNIACDVVIFDLRPGAPDGTQ